MSPDRGTSPFRTPALNSAAFFSATRDQVGREVDACDLEAQPGEGHRHPSDPARDVEDPAALEPLLGEIGRDGDRVLLAPLPHPFEDELVELRVPHEDVLGPVHASLSLGTIEKPGPWREGPRSALGPGDRDADHGRERTRDGEGADRQEGDAGDVRGRLATPATPRADEGIGGMAAICAAVVDAPLVAATAAPCAPGCAWEELGEAVEEAEPAA